MTTTGNDSLGTRSTLSVNGTDYAYYSLAKAAEKLGNIDKLPYTLKVLLENMLRFEDGGHTVDAKDAQAVVDWQKEAKSSAEIQYRPARVLMQDFTGVPAVVDLAAMRDGIKALGGDAEKINPQVPVHLVIDHSVMTFSLTGYSMPIFWWALLLMLVFSVTLGWTPVSGRIDVVYWIDDVTGFMLIDSLLSGEEGAFSSAVSHLILPSIVLGTIPMAVIARMTRSSMLEVLSEDYIRTARAKGIAPWRVIVIHALRNALIPVITVIGLQVGILLSGAILTETVFAWPGIGKWLIESIGRRDYPVVQGGILIVACIIIVVNLLVDITYGIVNPRIRHSR